MKDFQYPDDIYTEAEARSEYAREFRPIGKISGCLGRSTRCGYQRRKQKGQKKILISSVTKPIQQMVKLMDRNSIMDYVITPILYNQAQFETFHDQVGYWLWEPETGNILLTGSIPRGQTFIAVGNAPADANEFTVKSSTRFTNKRHYFESVLRAFIYHGKF